MATISSQQNAVLAITTLASLGVIFAMCLCCRKRSKIIKEEKHIYNQQTLHRDRRILTTVPSKRVTLCNQISRKSPLEQLPAVKYPISEASAEEQLVQLDYQNIQNFKNAEPTYVDPISASKYENEMNSSPDTDIEANYENVFPTISTKPGQAVDDDSDYENAAYLKHIKDEDSDEPDYENQKKH